MVADNRFLAVGMLVGLLPFLDVAGQAVREDSLWQVDLPDVVVTATKGPKFLRDVPVPTDVITREDIAAQGAMRVSDLLAEQTGLALVYDLGTGLQIQGMDAAYTLILIDGEPVIGRSGGTLDLDRLTVADLERVEIVRGPSSSLYGSEALAGVVNLITRKPNAGGLRGHTEVRYETHNTVDLTASGEVKGERFGARFLANRYSSGGYDLFPDLIGLTAPGFTDYTGAAHLTFTPGARTDWALDARLARQSQKSTVGLYLDGALLAFEEEALRTDWSLAPRMVHRFSPTVKLTTRLYAARFETDTALRDRTDDSGRAGETRFDQGYGKGEVQLDAVLGTQHLLTLGGGYIGERVEADRVQGGRRASYTAYGYAQHEWMPGEALDVVLSARLDVPGDYATRLSPKAAVLFKPDPRMRVRASVGSGFKAPTFQQRYMDFANPVGGYSVLGATDIEAALDRLEAQGQIRYYLADVAALGTLRPESAVSFNLGLEVDPEARVGFLINLFRNTVKDLIETLAVAAKTNGQNVFTYVNLSRVYTQGLDAELTLRPFTPVALTLGYQYLDARDQDVLAALEEGTLYKRVNGRDRRVRKEEYGGLFDRSRHSGTLHLRYRHPGLGLTASVRGVYRGRYGYGDRNGNLILDDDSEYVPGYAVWHVTATQRLGALLSVQAGVKNLFDKTNPELIPSLPGRLLFAGFRLNLNP